MEAFTPELLSILVLICVSWAGVTCILVLVLLIIFICSVCSKRRQLKSIKPSPTRRTSSSVSIANHSSLISPLPLKSPYKNLEQYKKPEQQKHYYDATSGMNEHPYSSHNNKNQYQQEEYTRDENDETTATINESRTYGQRHHNRRHHPVKPLRDMSVNDRPTPYPPDVLARDKLMNKSRFPKDNKY